MTEASCDREFDEVMARLRAGDQDAATLVFSRFVDRLIALAASRFESRLRHRADVEGVVLSACHSFFAGNRRGELLPDDWDELWALLAYITLRKCGKRRRALRAARRDAAREAHGPAVLAGLVRAPDRSPSPVELAICTETVDRLARAMAPDDRPIVDHILMGYTAEEVARRFDCSERTVRRVRQRAKYCLRNLIDAEGRGEEVV